MPTHEESGSFLSDVRHLTPEQRIRFLMALRRFIGDLRAMEAGERRWFRRGLRVKGVRGAPGLFEMTWAPDGRATSLSGLHRRVVCGMCSGNVAGPQHPVGAAIFDTSTRSDGLAQQETGSDQPDQTTITVGTLLRGAPFSSPEVLGPCCGGQSQTKGNARSPSTRVTLSGHWRVNWKGRPSPHSGPIFDTYFR